MNSLLAQFIKDYHLSKNEELILIYCMDHLHDLSTLTIRELASRTYTSTSTILRLVNKIRV